MQASTKEAVGVERKWYTRGQAHDEALQLVVSPWFPSPVNIVAMLLYFLPLLAGLFSSVCMPLSCQKKLFFEPLFRIFDQRFIDLPLPKLMPARLAG
jgi:hypothetical protein